jgi:hypothetical protein
MMAAETAPAGGERPALERRILWREVRRQVVYLGATLAAIAGVALLLSIAASAVQATRNEARTADVVIVVAPAVPAQALVDHTFELYRRGYAPRTLVVGPGAEGLRAALQERGMSDSVVLPFDASLSETAQLRAAAAAARAEGAGSALIAGDPAAMLRWLKLAGDEGLRGYPAPVPGVEPGPLELVRAGARYWQYVLFRR